MIEEMSIVILNNQKFQPGHYARIILNDYLETIKPFKGLKTEYVGSQYQQTFVDQCSQNSVRDHLGEKVNVFLKEADFGQADLLPILRKEYQRMKQNNELPPG
jgi:hypothetical protein